MKLSGNGRGAFAGLPIVRIKSISPSADMNIPTDLYPHRASLLDQDNQVLSTGTVRFDISKPTGTFYPEPLIPLTSDILKRVRTVKTLEGHLAEIQAIEYCYARDHGVSILHYHFD